MEAPRLVRLPDGRALALDDVGDPGGVPVVYLHGTPDSRLARHPDDDVAAECGVRLVAVDRPGAGHSDPHPTGTLGSLGADLRHLLDELAIDRTVLLGWSAGGLFALAAAGALGERTLALGLVGTVPPVEAYADAGLVAALGPGRRPFVELAAEMSPSELAAEMVPYLVPHPLTPDLALAHVLESAGELGRAELAAVPGAAEQLAEALAESVRCGDDGLAHDLALQLEPGLDLAAVRCPVRSFHGSDDGVSPPEVGAWLASHMQHAVLDLVPEAGHHLLFPRWRGILRALVRDASNP
ncbi:MAG: alpha/beta fold hydrolase [Acidimicrobiales bacterium]